MTGPRAIEQVPITNLPAVIPRTGHQTLGRVSASKGVTLNAAYRRHIGTNVGQANLSAGRQTFHNCPRHQLLTHWSTTRPSEVTPYRCGSLLGRASLEPSGRVPWEDSRSP